MNFWIKHPRTQQADTMLTLALAGFIFVVIMVVAAFVVSVIKESTIYLSALDIIAGIIIAPTLTAYTMRKNCDQKHSNGDHQ